MTNRGLSQHDLAQRIGLTPDKMSKALTGSRRFSSYELAAVAHELDVRLEWLLTGAERAEPRKAGRVTGLHQSFPNFDLAEDFEGYSLTLDRLGYGRPVRALPTFEPSSSFVTTGTRLARWASDRFQEHGFERIPNDLVTAIEATFDVDIAFMRMDRTCHGFAWQTDDFRLIALASTTNWARQRFTLAHELGHILSGDAHNEFVEELSNGDQKHYVTEKAANSFAAELLMSESAMRNAWSAHDRPEASLATTEMAWRLQVSPAALTARMQKLDLGTSADRSRVSKMTMFDVARALGHETEFEARATASSRDMPPRRLVSGLRRAFDDGRVSARPLAALTGMPVDEFLAYDDQSPSVNELEGLMDEGVE